MKAFGTALLLLFFFGPAAALLSSASPEVKGDQRVYFVQVTDTHLFSGDHLKRVQKIIKMVNALKVPVEFVALTGDITSGGMVNKTELESITNLMAGFKPPVYYLPGNHDIGHGKPRELEKTLGNYTNFFGGLNYTIAVQGVVFVFIFTEPLKEDYAVDGYEPLKWLKETLSQNTGLPLVIFHHSPSAEDFYNNSSHKSWPDRYRLEWESIIGAYTNVKGVIAGHFHRDELHWIGGVPYFVSAPVAGFWGRQGSFRLYSFDGERLSYTTIYIE